MAATDLTLLERRLSVERLSPYRAAVGGDLGLRGRGMRRDVHDAVAALHSLRNRIAHQEPIYNRPLTRAHEVAMQVADWISPDMRRWIEGPCQVPSLLAFEPSLP